MILAGIVAGGTGSRMGKNIPKQFLEILGKPVLVHTISCFFGKVDKICVACHKDYIDYTKELMNTFFEGRVDVIEGGADRMQSVQRIIDKYIPEATDKDIILTHDGVRPFVSERIIKESIENALAGHFCTVAINSTDTVCLSDGDGMIALVPDRNKVYNIQTPQTFNLKKLGQMLEKSSDKSRFTDMCGLALSVGEKVKLIEGSPENIKITVPADLKIAEAILKGDGQI